MRGLDRLRELTERLLPIKVGISISLDTRVLTGWIFISGGAAAFVLRETETAGFLGLTAGFGTSTKTSECV